MVDQAKVAEFSRQLVEWRRMFHVHPEVSNQERETSQRIVTVLKGLGVETQTFSKHFGVCGTIRGKHPGPVIVFRTDMDALSITEATGLEFQSRNPGVMHACGHDGHMAIALGVAKLFSECRNELAGTVKVIFQPAEEAAPVGGSSLLLQEGVLADADAIFGLHLWPDLPCGHIGVRSGPFMAASDRLTIRVIGRGAHAGQPQNGVDSITIAADIIQGLGQIMTRQIDPLETATLNIGTIHGGERYNVIAREVVMDGTVRTLSEKARKEIPVKIKRLLEGMTAAQEASYELDYQFGYPVLSNWEKPTEIIVAAAQQILGKNAVHQNIQPVLASEDFGRYLEKIPGAYFWLGCARENQNAQGLHSPYFDMDENALLVGAKIMYQAGILALSAFNKPLTHSDVPPAVSM